MENIDLLKEELKAAEENIPFATVTILSAEGTTTRSYGKMIVYPDGNIKGTVGGGTAELMAIKDAVKCIEDKTNAVKAYDTVSKASELGKVCGGKLTVFIEVFGSRPLILLCGAGHVGTATAKLAKLSGFQTLMLDDRDDDFVKESAKFADKFMKVDSFADAIKELNLPGELYVVVATHSHALDAQVMSVIFDKKPKYIGMLGSKMKIKHIFGLLKDNGISKEDLSHVYSPIGLNLGGEKPEEIAFAALAQIMMVKNDIKDANGIRYDINEILGEN
jgi:xanthine dehydrogenase accessory factor